MDIKLILTISILLQFIAAFLALRLIRITGRSIAWILIATAISLMAIRRSITLLHMFSGEKVPADLTAELVALVTSALILIGIALIAPLFLSIKRSEEALQKARDELRYAFKNGRSNFLEPTRHYRLKLWNASRQRRK